MCADGHCFAKTQVIEEGVVRSYLRANLASNGDHGYAFLQAVKAKFKTGYNIHTPPSGCHRLQWHNAAAWNLLRALRPYMCWYGRRLVILCAHWKEVGKNVTGWYELCDMAKENAIFY